MTQAAFARFVTAAGGPAGTCPACGADAEGVHFVAADEASPSHRYARCARCGWWEHL